MSDFDGNTSANGCTPLIALMASVALGFSGLSINDFIIGKIATRDDCNSRALELAIMPVGFSVCVAVTGIGVVICPP